MLLVPEAYVPASDICCDNYVAGMITYAALTL